MTDATMHAPPTRAAGAVADDGARRVGPPTLSVSLVTFRPDLPVLADTLRTLRAAVAEAQHAGVVGDVSLDVIDNGMDAPERLDAVVRDQVADAPGLAARILRGHGNVGYGRGHNLGMLASDADYHLVLNPDVLMDPSALRAGIAFLEAERDVGLVAPHVRDEHGVQQYLCRAYPSAFVLFLRGFAPGALRRLFAGYMAGHELRDRIGDRVVRDVPLISGCFMLGRRRLFQQVGGFSPEYFLYFEDSDLSLAMRAVGDVAYVPSVRIVHFGGGAGRKGVAHVRMFIASAATFFRRHGLKLF